MPSKSKMDFTKVILALNATADGANGTKSSLSDLPSTILEAFIPGYGILSAFFWQYAGFDIGIIITAGFIAFALIHTVSYIWEKALYIFYSYLLSSVSIDDGDDLFEGVLEWIASQKITQSTRSIRAVTRHGNAALDLDDSDGEALDESGIFNFSRFQARLPPRFEPHLGKHWFVHDNWLFIFDRQRREKASSPWTNQRSEEESIQLSCVGFSTKPIKALLNHIKIWSLEREKAMTVIRRPAPKDRGRGGTWDRVSSRPSRPMETVALDAGQKEKVVSDINEFLHPSSPRWYATRGIPYRRGYLFHGPPGTGKTSLSFALAGIFGLDIFVISLLEPTMTEADLNRLFNSLPRRCIVLLEDIDTAGLLREDDSKDDEESKRKDRGDRKDDSTADLARAIRSARKEGGKADDVRQGISLSGLLNAIDGVATHEGRVLVMTTNHPEKLDEALIRPGRVDLQVAFTLATREQIRDIFVRMYSNESDQRKFKLSLTNAFADGDAKGQASITSPTANGTAEKERVDSAFTPTPQHTPKTSIDFSHSFPSTFNVSSAAQEFASKLPDQKFSPAEIQGFLLTRKKEPLRALAEVDGWRKALEESKEKGGKVVRVQ